MTDRAGLRLFEVEHTTTYRDRTMVWAADAREAEKIVTIEAHGKTDRDEYQQYADRVVQTDDIESEWEMIAVTEIVEGDT